MRSLLFSCALVAGCGVSDVPFGESTTALDGTIRVTAYHWASEIPFAGTEVQFIAPDQTVQTVVTDANGFAEAVSPPNTRVVVFQDTEPTGSPLVRVFDAANPGDHIIAGRRTQMAFQQLGTIRFVLPPRTGWNNTQPIYYFLHVSCSPDNGWWTEAARDMRVSDCPHARNATAVAWIEDGATGLLTGPSVLRNIDLTAYVGGTIRMPAYEPKLTSVSGQFVNVPATAPSLSWGSAWFYGDDPTVFAFGSTEAARDVVNTRAALGVGDRTVSSLRFRPAGFADVNIFRIEPGFVQSFFVDASQTIRPVSFPTFDMSTQTINWNVASYGQPAQMVHAGLSVSGFGRRFRIEIYAPGDTAALTLPALPPALTPQPGDSTHASGFFYRISNETYSQWLQVHSTRNPLDVNSWSSTVPREVSIAW